MLSLVLQLSLVILSLAICGCIYRVLRGPSMADRVTALDTIGINLIGIVAVLSMLYETQNYLEIILLIGILTFIGTVAFAKYVERGVVFDHENDD